MFHLYRKKPHSYEEGDEVYFCVHICAHMHESEPTPVLLPGESQGRRSLVGCRLRGRTEWDMAEAT